MTWLWRRLVDWFFGVSVEWLRDQQRREHNAGLEQSCIDWDAMKRREL